MKKLLFLLILILLPMLASATMVSDVKNSGCLNKTLEEKKQPYPTIVLTKEGSVLSVQLLNYETYDATTDFNVTSSISGDTPYSVTINVTPVIPEGAEVYREWVCLFNVSFTVHDLEPNRFYLDCWWFNGLVELTEGEPMVLEYKVENVTIDDMSFRLLKVMHKAMLMNWTTTEEELQIPSEVNYEGEVYTVTSISKDAFWNVNNATKVTIPKTIRSMDIDYDDAIYANPFRECKALKWIEVEDGCPLFSSKDGVLFAEDKTMLLGYPIAAPSITYTVPEGVTKIRSGAFHHNMYLRKLVIPEGVTNLGWHLFNDTKSLEELYIKGVLEPECMRDLFGGMDTKVTVYVQSSEVEKFQAVYKGPVYPLLESGTDDSDYFPFVELGKQWNVVSTVASPSSSCHFEKYVISEAVERNGKTYFRVWQSEDDLTVVHDAGLYREENRRVYKYDETAGRDIMLYDFSLKEGDTFTYESEPTVKCKVLKQGWLDDGPDIMTSENKYRKLRTWTIGVENASGGYYEITWIEGIGTLRNMFYRPDFVGVMSCLAYVERDNSENAYLPFSLYNMYGPVHGCNLPTGAESKERDEWGRHHLTYELEGDRLHVYGEVFTQCGPNNYAYFYESNTDDPLVHKIEFEIQEVEPLMDCMALHQTDFYVPGFDPNLNYIVADNHGEEHPVINKTSQNEYRPLLEEGKVWKYSYNNMANQYMKSLTVSGDTIIGNQTYKKIVDVASQAVEMALREEDKKVYCCYPSRNTEILLYDFSKNAGEIISKEIKNGDTYIQKVTSVDNITVNDKVFRCMTVHEYVIPKGMSEEEYFAGNYGYDSGFWIEGIGSFAYLDSPISYPGNYYTFYECQIGDVTYKQKDFLDAIKNNTQPAYRPFVEEGKVWKVGAVGSGNPVQLVDYYYFDGDTIINGKTCKQMMCQRYVTPDFAESNYISQDHTFCYVGAWYEENKQVYIYDSTNKQFKMMYDFSVNADDTLQINNQSYAIGSKQTGGLKGFKGVYREVWECGDEERIYRCAPWMEGVGIVYGPPTLNVLNVELADPMWFLMSCTVGDEVIYFNDEYEDGATPGSMEVRKRFDFTHTIKTKPKARNRSMAEEPVYGEYNDKQLGINLNPLDDTYLVHITDETGKVVYEKSINAGNIVGLNVDISAYAKGRYTVTVENSDESFTGEFNAQGTGIEAIINNKVETRPSIYNLQGQRLSSLQRGLNIINGQKVFVK